MSIETLIAKIQEDLHELQLDDLTSKTVFKELEGWNSLHGLILMALISTEYQIDLSGEQIGSVRTVQDLYDTINGKG